MQSAFCHSTADVDKRASTRSKYAGVIKPNICIKETFQEMPKCLQPPLPRHKALVFEDYKLQFPENNFIYRVDDTRYESTVKVNVPVETLAKFNRPSTYPVLFPFGVLSATLSNSKSFSLFLILRPMLRMSDFHN